MKTPNLFVQYITEKSASEPAKAIIACKNAFLGVALFSGLLNLLALTGSIYMLQVYDRVVPGHSVPTLVGLSVMMIGLYSTQSFFDYLRTKALTRIGASIDDTLRTRVFETVLKLPLRIKQSGETGQPIRDLDTIRGFLSSLGPTALFDLPWMPFYLIIVYILHPLLGLFATAGGLILIGVTLLTETRVKPLSENYARSSSRRATIGDGARRNAEIIRSLGMTGRIEAIWNKATLYAIHDQVKMTDVNSSLSSISKALRQILQSGILGVGAWLVIHQEATGGVMIAASITMGRALAPIEIAIANWKPFLQARAAYDRLELVLKSLPADSQPMQLPNPSKSLDIEGLFVDAPGTQTQILMNISFKLTAGQALGVIGPSASGKSTLARVIANAWLPVRGAIRVDNASLDQWAADKLGAHIGYLPQDIELFDGTIAANIARFAEKPDPAAILEAAQAAGAHDMIVRLPKGYDTSVGYEGTSLSAGQRQRIGLARALYGNPFLVILDEPNAHLDAEGEAALAQAITKIRNREGIAIVIAHRPAALATVDQVLIMANGQVQAFGPKDEVLKKALVQPMPAQKPADEQAKNTGSQPNQYYAMRG